MTSINEITSQGIPLKYSDLFEKMINDIRALSETSTSVIQLAKESMIILKNIIDDLRKTIGTNPFLSVSDEIIFFRTVKPAIYCHWIYWHEILNYELHKPVGGNEILEIYYKKQLQKLNFFFEQHADFYMYDRSGARHLDEIYFTRNTFYNEMAHDVYLLDSDPSFSTSHDYLVSRMLANEMLCDYIDRQMSTPAISADSAVIKTELHWTGQKVALAELIHAFHASGVFNNSQTGLKKLALKLCDCFDVKIENIHKILEEIRLRKKNRTSFLDSLRLNLLRKMEEDDEHAL